MVTANRAPEPLIMDKLTSILVVASRHVADRNLLAKAVTVARSVGAEIHLFFCDPGPSGSPERPSDTREVEKAWEACASDRRSYLEALRASAQAPDLHVSVDSGCEQPLYKGIIKKIQELRPDLVMKSPSGSHPLRHFSLSSNDWQLLQMCPVTLMLVHEREWHVPPRFGALVDVSKEQFPHLAEAIIHTSERFALGCRGELDVIYSEPEDEETAQRERAVTLERLVREYLVNAEHVHILRGDPDVTLPEFARKQCYDVLLMGALTHRSGIRALMGTLTGRLVDALECDFILVKDGTSCDDRVKQEVAYLPAGMHAGGA